jgi:hypothetical protein
MCGEYRIRELVALIDSEKDPEKVALLAAKLERLLAPPEPETPRCETRVAYTRSSETSGTSGAFKPLPAPTAPIDCFTTLNNSSTHRRLDRTPTCA